jgi:hypothetical protein
MPRTSIALTLTLAHLVAAAACAVVSEDPDVEDRHAIGMCGPGETLTDQACSFKLTSATPWFGGASVCYVDSTAAQGEGWNVVTTANSHASCECGYTAQGKKTCADFGATDPSGSGSPACKDFTSSQAFGEKRVYGGGFYDVGSVDYAISLALADCNIKASQRCDSVCVGVDVGTAAGHDDSIQCCVKDNEEVGSSSEDGGSADVDEVDTDPYETPADVPAPSPIPVD